MQKKARSMKQSLMYNFNALKSTFQRLSNLDFFGYPIYRVFQYEFRRPYGKEYNTFKSMLFHNMDNLEKQLNKEILHEKDSKSALSVIKEQIEKFLHSEVLKLLNYDGLHSPLRNVLLKEHFMHKRFEKSEIVSRNDLSKIRNDQSLGNESSKSGNESSRSGNECSEKRNSRNDTYIRPSSDTEPMAAVQNIADYNVFVVEKQPTEQP
uniref:Uncharacterized protein n=1 Tax=Tanacetum cinerariifolium TaxID=118510 RepID=A0A6L2NCF9_TANCI|nr:hypothetical protein [Tanacetum cinerariifolium]